MMEWGQPRSQPTRAPAAEPPNGYDYPVDSAHFVAKAKT